VAKTGVAGIPDEGAALSLTQRGSLPNATGTDDSIVGAQFGGVAGNDPTRLRAIREAHVKKVVDSLGETLPKLKKRPIYAGDGVIAAGVCDTNMAAFLAALRAAVASLA
jgi:hypothetical protein